MLTFVGLGLWSVEDVTMRGKRAIEKADFVFAEFYTSHLMGSKIEELEKYFGKKIRVLSREEVESGKLILQAALEGNAVLLVAGDPMIATTHVALRIMAEERGIKTKIVHNSSIVTAAPGLLGLQQYKFGRTVSIPFPQENYFPTSAYDFIYENFSKGLHTLILLDLNPRPMTANEAIEILEEMESRKKRGIIKENTLLCVVARAGSENPLIRADRLKKLKKEDFGPPLHTLVLPGKLHFAEAEALVKLAHAPQDITQ
ncbi:MAG: diphthine synthase [Thermoplasmata archaeon]|nr:diphthine synthase [Thermoplasmata archaeon]